MANAAAGRRCRCFRNINGSYNRCVVCLQAISSMALSTFSDPFWTGADCLDAIICCTAARNAPHCSWLCFEACCSHFWALSPRVTSKRLLLSLTSCPRAVPLAGPDLFGGDPFLGSMLGPGDITGAGGLGGGLGGFAGGAGAGLGGELHALSWGLALHAHLAMHHLPLPAITVP